MIDHATLSRLLVIMKKENKEPRREKRVNLRHYLGVYDNESSKMIGHVANFSRSGFMIIGHSEFKEGQTFSFCTKTEFDEQLPFEAVSRWNCESDDNTKHSGFEFTVIPKNSLINFSRYL